MTDRLDPDYLKRLRAKRREDAEQDRRITEGMINGTIPLKGRRYEARIQTRVVLRELPADETSPYAFLRELSEYEG